MLCYAMPSDCSYGKAEYPAVFSFSMKKKVEKKARKRRRRRRREG